MQHFVNISGGKDSAACLLIALERGRPFRPIMADTGHENDVTMEYVERLPERTGCPPVEIYRADFTLQIARKREFVAVKWREQGVSEAIVERALQVLQPTGNPFLDLCIWKGRFPSRKAQFCTEQLKASVISDQCVTPARAIGPVIQWLGVRRDESLNRRNSPMFQRVRTEGLSAMLLYRPLIHWTAADVFALAASRGLPANPLYLQGMSRVGCFPCINENKKGLAQIGKRFPEAFEKLAEWEAIVAMASKRGQSTFFCSDKTPEGAALSADLRAGRARADSLEYPGALQVAEWATTSRGGKQFQLALDDDEGLSCSSQYGLCE